jgi:hypothetical protein
MRQNSGPPLTEQHVRGIPPGDAQAAFAGGEDPERFVRIARREPDRRAVPAARRCNRLTRSSCFAGAGWRLRAGRSSSAGGEARVFAPRRPNQTAHILRHPASGLSRRS